MKKNTTFGYVLAWGALALLLCARAARAQDFSHATIDGDVNGDSGRYVERVDGFETGRIEVGCGSIAAHVRFVDARCPWLSLVLEDKHKTVYGHVRDGDVQRAARFCKEGQALTVDAVREQNLFGLLRERFAAMLAPFATP